MYRALMATEAPLSSVELRHDLEEAGLDVIAEIVDATELTREVLRLAPDIVVAAAVSPSMRLIEAASQLGTLSPRPFILFTSDGDADKIQQASDAGVHAYVVDGYARHRLLSIIQVARARFRHEQVLKEELSGLSRRFEERKQVDRAKGVLMRARDITEDEAFELLRALAMRTRQRLGAVAQSVIDMSRAGEAVNRAGQLRMLSQRIVKCYAQALSGLQAEDSLLMLADSAARVDANLGILRRSVSVKGYAELVERVAASWADMLAVCGERPQAYRLVLLDERAEVMLREAERLTEFLESSGLVSTLHVLNVAGRQRMLSQRIAKLCFLVALSPDENILTQLQTQVQAFQAAMEYLTEVPLSSRKIRQHQQAALNEWERLRASLVRLGAGESAALQDVAESSEGLLHVVERLTDEYEQAMQTLVGDRMSRLK